MLSSGIHVGHGFFHWESVDVPWTSGASSTLISFAAVTWFMGSIAGFILTPMILLLINKQTAYVSEIMFDYRRDAKKFFSVDFQLVGRNQLGDFDRGPRILLCDIFCKTDRWCRSWPCIRDCREALWRNLREPITWKTWNVASSVSSQRWHNIWIGTDAVFQHC